MQSDENSARHHTRSLIIVYLGVVSSDHLGRISKWKGASRMNISVLGLIVILSLALVLVWAEAPAKTDGKVA
jgi:hypothetical protein